MSTWITIILAALLSAHPGHGHHPKHPVHHGKPSKTWTQPYGGCKEAALYPGTPGYRDCKKHGLI